MMLLLGVLACAARAAAAPGELSATVDPRDGYIVEVGGTPWLHSGGLRLFAGGEWHSISGPSPPSPPPACSTVRAHTDVGPSTRPVATLPNVTREQCCVACLNQPGCDSWSRPSGRTGPCSMLNGGTGLVNTTSPHEAALVVKPSTPPTTGTIVVASGPATTAGTDRFGRFTRVGFGWQATGSSGIVTRFTTAIRSYTAGDVVIFEQGIPEGATKTNYKNITLVNEGNPERGGFDETLPFLHWPSFDTSHKDSIFNVSGRVGFSTWRGTFLPQVLGIDAPPASVLGLTGGPVVIYRGDSNGSALMVSPASHFKGAVQNRWGGDWVSGVSGEVTEVPFRLHLTRDPMCPQQVVPRKYAYRMDNQVIELARLCTFCTRVG
eukprot:m.238914 g.238914  ORF g.238914 m.238914 type:complete len:378 (+) comp26243_c0_seq8:128-1261(+)